MGTDFILHLCWALVILETDGKYRTVCHIIGRWEQTILFLILVYYLLLVFLFSEKLLYTKTIALSHTPVIVDK